jgi:hypothetical protein
MIARRGQRDGEYQEGPRRGTAFVVRRLVLLALVAGFLVIPVVAIAVNAFSSQSQSTQSPLVCSAATTPCQLPPSGVSP